MLETARSRKMIRRPHNIIYYPRKSIKKRLVNKLCANAVIEALGRQKICLRIKMNSKTTNKLVNRRFSDVFRGYRNMTLD